MVVYKTVRDVEYFDTTSFSVVDNYRTKIILRNDIDKTQYVLFNRYIANDFLNRIKDKDIKGKIIRVKLVYYENKGVIYPSIYGIQVIGDYEGEYDF